MLFLYRLFSCCTTFMLQYLNVAPFCFTLISSCNIFRSRLSYCIFFMLFSFYVALFLCCTFLVYFFLNALFSCRISFTSPYFIFKLFPDFTFFILHFFILYSFLAGCTYFFFISFYFFSWCQFLYCTFFLLHFPKASTH